MNSRNDENIKELFERFMTTEQAENSLEDIQKTEQILHEHPAPEPDDMLIANIKAEIAMRLSAQKTSIFRKTAYRIACTAAAILIISAISIKLFDNNEHEKTKTYIGSIIPTRIWESDDITTDDADLANYTIEIQQLEDELLALQSGEDPGSNSYSSVSELEMELVAINNDFWKE